MYGGGGSVVEKIGVKFVRNGANSQSKLHVGKNSK